jgi:hypothetical protein
MGEELQWDDAVWCVLECWVDVKVSAEGFPNVPSVVCGIGSLARDSQGDISHDKLEFSLQMRVEGTWASVQEGLIGKWVFRWWKNS